MSIIRTQHNKENPYVILNKNPLEDSELSWPAKGLWAYLMSKPDHWHVSVNHLCTIYKERGGGKEAIYNYLNELIESGYCQRIRSRDEKGHYGDVEYVITEFKNKLPQTGLPDVDTHDEVKPDSSNKEDIVNNDNKRNVDVSAVSGIDDKLEALGDLQLDKDAVDIALQYSVEQILMAVRCCKSNEPDNVSAYFIMAIRNAYTPSIGKKKKKEESQVTENKPFDYITLNKAYWNEIKQKPFEKLKRQQLRESSDYIELRDQVGITRHFYYRDATFLETLKCLFYKLELIDKDLEKLFQNFITHLTKQQEKHD